MSGTTIAVIAIGATFGLTAVAAIGACLGAGRQRRRQDEHARRVIAARDEVRAAQGRPRDGRPLDDYEKHLFASVLIGFMTSPGDSSDERENRL